MFVYKKSKINPLCLALIVCLVLMADAIVGAAENGLSGQLKEAKAVWASDNGQGEQIFFSSYRNQTWNDPVQLSNDDELVFQPAVASGPDGKTWAVWSRQENGKSSLRFSFSSSSGWSSPQSIPTGMKTNTAATIMVSRDNIPVIAWTGAGNSYSDIYWSRWNGQGWETPHKVHDDNKVPDLQPSLALDVSGNIVVSWKTYTTGKYQEVARMLQQGQWLPLPDQNVDIPGRKRKMPVPKPKFIKDERKASVFIQDKDGAGSIKFLRR